MKSGFKSKRLLLYGYDQILLETRCSVLRIAGFDICTLIEPGAFKSALDAVGEPYDLLVICHSVPVNERDTIRSLAAQFRMPIFQIEAHIQPEKLVAEVLRLGGPPKAA